MSSVSTSTAQPSALGLSLTQANVAAGNPNFNKLFPNATSNLAIGDSFNTNSRYELTPQESARIADNPQKVLEDFKKQKPETVQQIPDEQAKAIRSLNDTIENANISDADKSKLKGLIASIKIDSPKTAAYINEALSKYITSHKQSSIQQPSTQQPSRFMYKLIESMFDSLKYSNFGLNDSQWGGNAVEGSSVRFGKPCFDDIKGESKLVPGQKYEARATSYYPADNAMEGGFVDRKGYKLNTLQDFLDGKADYVSVAMDSKACPYGTKITVEELDTKYGRHIPCRVVDTGGAFQGRGTGRIDICQRTNNDCTSNNATNGKVTIVADNS